MLAALLLSVASHAQDVRYISDKQYIPLRSGAGSDYRIIHRGIPSGTRLTVARTSADGEWAEITTDKGTTGWIRSQYLMEEMPAQNKLTAAQRRAASAIEESSALKVELDSLKAERAELLSQIETGGAQLGSVSEELAQLKQVSGNAVQLDIDNRRLVEESERLRSEVETLEAENQRLQDKLQSEDFINGALAVLMGVIITLVVPRVWPKRRKSSSWA
jgi:SH3 domain protein